MVNIRTRSHFELTCKTGRRPIKQAAEVYMPLSTSVQLANGTSSPICGLSRSLTKGMRVSTHVGSFKEAVALVKKYAVRMQDATRPLRQSAIRESRDDADN